jgi:hypothetical protein
MAKELEKDHDYYGHVAKALGEPVFFEPNPQTLKIGSSPDRVGCLLYGA